MEDLTPPPYYNALAYTQLTQTVLQGVLHYDAERGRIWGPRYPRRRSGMLYAQHRGDLGGLPRCAGSCQTSSTRDQGDTLAGLLSLV
jgi:hypothetical protein